MEECGPCPIIASFPPEFALQLRKKHGKTSVRVAEHIQQYYILHVVVLHITFTKTLTHY